MAAALKIRIDALRVIEKHAQQFPAEEVCGLLAGKNGIVELALRTLNASVKPAVEYQIAPVELFAAMRAIRDAGMQFMGIYHSHPNGTGEPSARDVDEANYPHVAYVIATVPEDGTVNVRAFSIRDGAVEEMAIEVTSGSTPVPSARRR
ncbi:MAG: M67 family metallopeptidase [Candidatus Acidiferrales bacterium]